jgi:hypothetical protein
MEDVLTETAVVCDHLGRVHSARTATYGGGKLLTEAAALYLPQDLPAKTGTGTQAAAVAAAAAVSPPLAGGSSSAAAAASGAVGYCWAGGKATWGVLRDPEAVGLPRQRTPTIAAYEQVRAPPWQLHTAPEPLSI